MDLAISNVINISESLAPAGLGSYNTSNLALFSTDEPGNEFGSDGYKIYRAPSGVTTDFGSASRTSKMATKVFSQKPNILAGGGYLAVIPMVVEVQTIGFDVVAASGAFELNFGAEATTALAWNATAADIQAALRLLTGLEGVTVTGSIAAQSLVVTFYGYYGDAALLTVTNNTLQDAVSGAVTVTPVETTAGETLGAAITRTKATIHYLGVIQNFILNETDSLAAAAILVAANKLGFDVSRTSADVDPAGRLDKLRTGSFYNMRGLFYGEDTDVEALEMMAAYAGRALSTNFSGSNTTQTMHLKDLIGIQPDPSMTESLYAKCKTAGVDVYASVQGVPKVLTSGTNRFFDRVYNLLWFIGALEVAGFNALAQSSTKVPQTEQGVSVLTGAYRTVCQQAVTNQFAAPGAWNSPDTFGELEDFYRNIEEVGFYIYSQPVNEQLQADRDARKAPLVQIAIKEAGANHSSDVLVFVNA